MADDVVTSCVNSDLQSNVDELGFLKVILTLKFEGF